MRAGADAVHVDVPEVKGLVDSRVERDGRIGRTVVVRITQQQLDAVGVWREQGKVDAAVVGRRAERVFAPGVCSGIAPDGRRAGVFEQAWRRSARKQ